MKYQNTLEYARELDSKDVLHKYRSQYLFPKHNGKDCVYLCGNSLGLQPKSARQAIELELDAWQEYGVEGHFKGTHPWMYYHKFLTHKAAKLVNALPSEVVIMNNLTSNLHLMMVSFYRPQGKRTKILMEGGAFPSDQYAMESQARFHGLDPDKTIVELVPREGERCLRTEDILDSIRSLGDELAIVMMGGVNYYTGQLYDMQAITKEAHANGAVAGFDLAHAAGNVELHLHEWDVDFAVWCTYKYLNSGPGGTSGVFVHERHGKNADLPRFAGWWGHQEESRFLMKKGFIPMEGAQGWQLSNAQIFPMAIHLASLKLFDEAGMPALVAKSKQLTGYLEFLVHLFNKEQSSIEIEIITPATEKDRGCQLSLIVSPNGKKVHEILTENGVISDWREPDVIRVAPVPMYNSFEDVYNFYSILKDIAARLA